MDSRGVPEGTEPNEVSKVVELVDQDCGWWNEALIDRTFDAHSAAIVKQVLLQNVCRFRMYWVRTFSGGGRLLLGFSQSDRPMVWL
jgi:hypothetical protein